jgi:hypothetical protein
MILLQLTSRRGTYGRCPRISRLPSTRSFSGILQDIQGRRSSLPVQAHADFVYLINVALGKVGTREVDGKVGVKASLGQQLNVIRECIGKYEV